MTWSARIVHTPAGLALTFGAPLSRLDMSADVAQHLASLLAVEARHRMRGVVSAVEKTEELRRFPYRTENLNDSDLRGTAPRSHPLCCDCSACLNGDHDV